MFHRHRKESDWTEIDGEGSEIRDRSHDDMASALRDRRAGPVGRR